MGLNIHIHSINDVCHKPFMLYITMINLIHYLSCESSIYNS